jgi:pSer/pThr/pTyr-binding forkhead associated (FHA) protein
MKIKVFSEYKTYTHTPEGPVVVIGRSDDIDFPIPNQQLSRKHCEIHFQNEKIYIQDLGSKNGVIVDGLKIEPMKKFQITVQSNIMLTKDLGLSVTLDKTRTKIELEKFMRKKVTPLRKKKYRVLK